MASGSCELSGRLQESGRPSFAKNLITPLGVLALSEQGISTDEARRRASEVLFSDRVRYG